MQQEKRHRKILLVSNKVYHYRVPVYEHLSARLREIGYELVVLANEVENGVSVPTGFELQIEPFGYFAYREKIRRVQPSIVIFFLHARDYIVWPLLLMLKLRGTDVIYWNHGVNLRAPDNSVRQVIFSLFHRFADAIILYSVNEEKYVARKFRDKLFIANNTINFDSIPDIPESKDSIRKELGIAFRKVVLFVGRITADKRLDDLIAAAAELDDGIGVVIVGDGLTAQQAAHIKTSRNIRYLGAVYEPQAVNRIFKMADVFSIPGKVGLGVNQAFYWGLPIVTEDVRHSPEIVYVKDGVNGFIVDKHDTHMLAEKINQLLSTETSYRRFSEAARTEILKSASIDTMCDGFINAILFLQQRADG